MDNSNDKYSSSLPYPKVNIKKQNKKYAKIILEDFSGMNSEMTIITQYLSHYIILKKEYSDIAVALKNISKVEMTHLELLGDILVGLGQEPIYGRLKGNKLEPWTGKYIKYSNDLKAILSYSIEDEKAAIKQYSYHISLIDDPNISSILSRIILDEEIHCKILCNYFDKFF